MIRIMTAAFLVGAMALPAMARAQSESPASGRAWTSRPVAARSAVSEMSAQRRRMAARLRITPNRDPWPDDVYPRYDPGPNAVRVCNATYVQEHRPSGTVIVPRMSCYWRRG
jgi:hypothetical protein